MKNNTLLAALTLFISTSSLADWSGSGDLGFNSVSGNSDSDSLAVGLKASYQANEKWLHSGEFSAFNASQDGEKSAESFGLSFQSDYSMNEQTFAFGRLSYQDDRFSGYENQTSTSFGLGRTFIDDGIQLFTGQLGLGYRKSELANNLGDQSEAILTSQITYNRSLTGTTNLETAWVAESGSDNTYLEGAIAIIVAMTDTLGLKLSYTAKHNTDVPVGTVKTDRYTTISLNYSFD